MAFPDTFAEKRPEVCHITGIGAVLEKQPDDFRMAVLARGEDRIIEDRSRSDAAAVDQPSLLIDVTASGRV